MRLWRNPSEPYICGSIPPHQFPKTSFDSVKEARAFLTYKVPEMGIEECQKNAEKIEFAKKLVARADKRNQKRQLKRRQKRELVTPGLPVIRPTRPTIIKPTIEAPKKEIAHFEETLGPDGEIIRFKLDYSQENGKCKFKRRTRTQIEPPIGSIILDLTCGIKAWKRFSDKRRTYPISDAMMQSYKNSIIYKTRQLAAGKISLREFSEIIQNEINNTNKKLRRKNQKKR